VNAEEDEPRRRPPRNQSTLVERFEEVVRDNERIRNRLADLEPAVGHFDVLVQLAKAVREFRRTQDTEAQLAMFAILDDYERRRPWGDDPN
jgi:hypothetical protein